MSTPRAKRPVQQQRRCYFCDKPAGMSPEHAWPDWMSKYAVDVPGERHTSKVGFTRTGESSYEEHPNTVVTQPGSVLKTRPRVVCNPCNTGWMSQKLEQPAQPLLKRLWAKDYIFGATTLSPADAAVVAAWAVKTLWMHAAGGRLTTPPLESRRYLLTELLPPPYSYVAAGRHLGEKNFNPIVGDTHFTDVNAAWDSDEVRHVLFGSLTFMGVCLMVATVDGPGSPEPRLENHYYWRTLWPITEYMQWPPPLTLSDDDVERAATGLYRTGSSIAQQADFTRHPDGLQRIRRN